MAFNLQRKPSRILPIRVALWSSVAIVAFAVLLHQNPISMEGSIPRSDGVELTRTTESDVLVVLDYMAIRQSGPAFSEVDFSAAWIDLLEREIGPVAVATPETLTDELISASRLLVATRSVTQEMPEAFLNRLRDHALEGHTVIVDQPRGRAREVFSSDGQAGPRRGQRITYSGPLSEPYDEQLATMPILVNYQGSTAAREDIVTYLSIDGAPVVYSVDFGRGSVITIDFDLGAQIVALQQGRPAEDFSVPRDTPTTPGIVRTADLVAHPDLVGAAAPHADLLGRYLVQGVFAPQAGLPTLWSFPESQSGAVIFVHEDTRLGDHGAWKLDYERRFGGTSTLVTSYDSGLTPEGAEKIQDKGGHIGLAWRPPHPSVTHYQRLGIGGFRPFRQPIDLNQQRRDVRAMLSGGALGTSRSLEGIWSDHWSAPLEALAEAGMRSDISYEVPTHRGYSFGSGFPFRALNEAGIPLEIREYPVIIPAAPEEGPTVEDLIAASAAGHHQLITVASEPAAYADYPDMDRFQAWLSIFETAAEYDHGMLSVLDYAQFYHSRRRSSVRSRLDRRASLPERLRSAQTAPSHRATLLRVTARADRRDIDLIVPTRIGDAEFVGALEGTERVGAEIVTSRLETDEASTLGLPMRRVRLAAGFNNFEFYYH